MIPEFEVIDDLEPKSSSGGKNPLFDYETGRLIMKDGKLVYGSTKDKIKQWIYLLIRTEVGKYRIYDESTFGLLDVYALRGHQYHTSKLGISDMKKELKKKIEARSEVKEVRNISVMNTLNKLEVTFTVLLVTGETIEGGI